MAPLMVLLWIGVWTSATLGVLLVGSMLRDGCRQRPAPVAEDLLPYSQL
jgi:hypothetical protein